MAGRQSLIRQAAFLPYIGNVIYCIKISVIGTRPIARLSIIRGVGSEAPEYVYDSKVGQSEVKLTWTDQDAQWGTTSYYYVRIEQETTGGGYGALAWASPMWITRMR